jgi:hypothetical protein
MTHKYCNGCYSILFSDIFNECTFHPYNDNGNCPCTKCIIKMMCDDPCDDFSSFRLNTLWIIEEEKEE